MENNILLDVKGLKTYFHTFKGVVKAVDDVSFTLKEGEILGIEREIRDQLLHPEAGGGSRRGGSGADPV